MINAKTQLNLVIGNPLDHTKSPLLHNAAYRLLNCNAVMLAHSTKHLSRTIDALKSLSVGLTAVTMPYKEAIIPYLDEMSDEVEKLKVANTVIQRNGKLIGYNTDIDGIAYAFRNIEVRDKSVLLIGAGGASRAAAYFLNQQNAKIYWLNRTREHVFPLLDMFGGSIVEATSVKELPVDIIINTTPLGMFPLVESSPLEDYPFTANQVIFDMVYNPMNTLLIKEAQKQAATCISGLDMFVGQGLKQIELWLNKPLLTNDMLHLMKNELYSSLNKLLELV